MRAMIDPKDELNQRRGAKSWRELGEELGISHGYLWQVSHGNLPPSDRLLEKLGLKVVYERVNATSAGINGKDRRRAANRG